MARKKSKSAHKEKPVLLTTLLVVAEGEDDRAFIGHMKELFFQRRKGYKGPKIESADGGSPHDILKAAAKLLNNRDYDHRIVVMDSDEPVKSQDRKAAEQKGFKIIQWSPQCLEGALLDVLGQRVNPHESSQKLKARLHPQLADHHTKPEAYAVKFPRPVLEHHNNTSVKEVRNVLEGREPNDDGENG